MEHVELEYIRVTRGEYRKSVACFYTKETGYEIVLRHDASILRDTCNRCHYIQLSAYTYLLRMCMHIHIYNLPVSYLRYL